MQYLLTPYARTLATFSWWENAFTNDELDWLQQRAKAANLDAAVGGKGALGGVNKDQRRCQVDWLKNTSESQWVFERLAHIISQLNADSFNFNITGFGEPLQLTNYDQSENGMYGWHVDYGMGISRKLSLTLQLTDPSEYEGGNLQLMTSGVPETVRKQRGFITVFPSYVLHQVTPVTQGSRQSLVAWISGPGFK